MTSVTRARPQFTAEPEGIENLDATGQGSYKALDTKLPKHPGYYLTHRTDTIGQVLLTHHGCKTAISGRTRRSKIQQMTDDTLTDRRERISGELLQHVVQTVDRLLGQNPRNSGVMTGDVPDARDVEEVHGAFRHGLNEDRRGAAYQRRPAKELPRAGRLA